ncbi:type IV secretion system protein VirB4 [Bacillus sp. FSL M8-0256]|uniref:VirB4 family type IV secretion system protein n=1 Tax=Bacillus TaxID=1386 RepID=UPI0013BD44B4|nr:type IV secretion system protein VirB4 [Bacillus subtilis]KAF2427333.1 type IV secretion system protein VirB4 [Bacillus subtilis]MEC0312071.1 type IV secretion system protein VirB4 [Bacillus subtilis]MEC0363621.1 type IV secretion system protein VirB4 [Bacillus subtilis]
MFNLKLKKKKNDAELEKEIKRKKGYNPSLLAKIQPQGGISFPESYVRKGDGYEACIHVYDYPKMVSDFWLVPLMNMENAITTLDVVSDKKNEVVKALNKSMAEQNARYNTEKENVGRLEAEQNYRDMEKLFYEISQQGEVMKRIHLRHFVSGKTIADLEKRVKDVLETLEAHNFKGSIFLNEQEYEWRSLTTGFDTQSKYFNKRKGKALPALTLAGGFPFHFTQLNDPYGTFYGTTQTKGNVIWDLFHRDKQRKSYNAVMVGSMGSGKSTFLKKISTDMAIKGFKVRGFDVVGEFEDLVKALGGKTIALDGSDGCINPLQVFKTAETEHGSFTQHLSKLSIFYRFIAPEATDDDIKEYENLLRKLYIQLGLWDDAKGEENNITSLDPDEYPIFTNYLNLIRDELYEDFDKKIQRSNLSPDRRSRLEKIELAIVNLVENYSHLFNGTSTIENFDEEQVVFFALRHLLSLKPEIYQAQLFNVMNLLWDSMLKNGTPQLKAFNKGTLKFEDAMRFLIVIDEAHHIINTRKGNEHSVLFLTKFAREARKYFGGMIFASHSIRDFVPEGSDLTAVEAIKTLFELTQYKLLMQQDSNNLNMLRDVFHGQLSESEIDAIPYLQQGDMILSIKSVKNVRFNVECSPEELALFGGGA